ncbi:MAG: hypothetical protein ABFR33_00085 [Verrucomicrobiota bacterium]
MNLDPAELYNLANDPGEQKNSIKQHPERAEAMAKELKSLAKGEGIRK